MKSEVKDHVDNLCLKLNISVGILNKLKNKLNLKRLFFTL